MSSYPNQHRASRGVVSEPGRSRQGAGGPREAPQRANVAYGPYALTTRVQLLIDSPDSSGQIVAQRVEWLGGSNLPGFSSTHFEVPIRERASPYRVSVFAFDFVQSARVETP